MRTTTTCVYHCGCLRRSELRIVNHLSISTDFSKVLWDHDLLGLLPSPTATRTSVLGDSAEAETVVQVKLLRDRFQDSISPGGIAGDRRGVVPGTGFPISAQEVWRVIKENKDLDLPAHKVYDLQQLPWNQGAMSMRRYPGFLTTWKIKKLHFVL